MVSCYFSDAYGGLIRMHIAGSPESAAACVALRIDDITLLYVCF
jgi:hypothetical protein